MRFLPFLLLLSGCWYLDEARYRDKVQDVDGDGAIAERFGGPDCVDDDPTIADCDADGDGYKSTAVGGPDCDDTRADIYPVPWYDDDDGDVDVHGDGGRDERPDLRDLDADGRRDVERRRGGDGDDDTAVGHWDTHGESVEAPFEFRDDPADGLGGTGGGGDDVEGGVAGAAGVFLVR